MRRRARKLFALALLLAAACAQEGRQEAEAYGTVLAALADSVGVGTVLVQRNAILARGGVSAPGDQPEHFLPEPSAAIVEAVEAAVGSYVLCDALAAACLGGGPGTLLALSEIEGVDGDEGTTTVWATLTLVGGPDALVPWEIRYYRVTLQRSRTGWTAGTAELVGGEP